MISFSSHPWSQTPDKPACTWLAAACSVLSHPDRRRSTAVPSNQFRTRSSEQELKTHQPLWTGCLVHNDGNERKHCDRWHVARNLPWPLKWPSIDRGRVKQPKYREQWWMNDGSGTLDRTQLVISSRGEQHFHNQAYTISAIAALLYSDGWWLCIIASWTHLPSFSPLSSRGSLTTHTAEV
jgi:hypothetical protein